MAVTPKFIYDLEFLSIGDEIGFKSGKNRLVYKGKEDPINGISIIVSGLGICAALQILRSILVDADTTVQDIELLWINEKKNEFILNKELEILEANYPDVLFVNRVIDNDIANMEVPMNESIRDAISPYEYGRIVIICAPELVSLKCNDLLYAEDGYPEINVVNISSV
jgi:ferredoxin-NADP reductase